MIIQLNDYIYFRKAVGMLAVHEKVFIHLNIFKGNIYYTATLHRC